MHGQEVVALRRLRPSAYNPREMPDAEMRSLKRSLREFGFVEPVVARAEDDLVIGGHQRVAAMLEILREDGHGDPGSVEVPVVRLSGVTDERAKLLNLALNRIHGEWDYVRLSEVLESLGSVDESELSLSGFGAAEIEDIMRLSDWAPSAPPRMEDVDEMLRREARRFAFEVATDAEAAECAETLRTLGMTGRSDAGAAFVRAMRAVRDHAECCRIEAL